jgi:uncharacterized protein YkwD
LSRLDFDNRLATAATGHADAMAAADFYSHTGANGSGLSKRVSDVGYPWRLLAETLPLECGVAMKPLRCGSTARGTSETC